MPYLKSMTWVFIINVVLVMFLIGLTIGVTLAWDGSKNNEKKTQNTATIYTQPQIQFHPKMDQALKPVKEKHKNLPIYAPTEPTFKIMDLAVSTSFDASSDGYSYSLLTKDQNLLLVFNVNHKKSEYEARQWLYENFIYLNPKKEMVELGNGLTGGFEGSEQKGTLEWHVGFWTFQVTGQKERAIEEGKKYVTYLQSHELLPTEGVISIHLQGSSQASVKWTNNNMIYGLKQDHYSGNSLLEAVCSMRLYPDLRVIP